jgi:hypothetical protein
MLIHDYYHDYHYFHYFHYYHNVYHYCYYRVRRQRLVAEEKLRKLITGWSAVRDVVPRAPRTCSEWADAQIAAREALCKLEFAVPRLPTARKSYFRTWTVIGG